MKPSKKFFLYLMLFLAIWEIIARLGVVPTYSLPPISQVIILTIQELFQGQLFFQTMNSILMIIQALIISTILSLIIAYLCTVSTAANNLTMTICTIMNPLPSVAVLPLVMIWFGIGSGATLVLVIHATLWPLIISLDTGFKTVSNTHLEAARNLGLSHFQMIRDILIFSALPHFLSGVKIGWSRAWRALLSIEMIFGTIKGSGLGFYIYIQRAYANITGIFAGILVIVVIGVFVEMYVFNTIDRHTVSKWGVSK